MPGRDHLYDLPNDLPVPNDDSACAHLTGMVLPSIPHSSTAKAVKDCDMESEPAAMPPAPDTRLEIQCHPVTGERWRDLEALFGVRGASGGCWCMWWRLARSQYNARKGAGNKRALQERVQRGDVPGLLAYIDGQPVGWCAVEPRHHYPVLERSRILKRVDDQPVWAIVCFFVSRPFRHQGVTTALLQAAITYAEQQGATIIEGYPVEPKTGRTADAFVYTGLASAFLKVGFVEVVRRSETRPIMRYEIDAQGR